MENINMRDDTHHQVSGRHGFYQPITLPFFLPTRIYGAMLAIWQLRPTLQRRFPLHRGRAKDYIRFLAWCVVYGRMEYRVLRHLPAWDAELSQPIDLPVVRGDKWGSSFSVGLFLYAIAKHHYTFEAIMLGSNARARVVQLFLRGERHTRRYPQLPDWQIHSLRKVCVNTDALLTQLFNKKKDQGKDRQQLLGEFAVDDLYAPDATAAGGRRGSVAPPPIPRTVTFSLAEYGQLVMRLPNQWTRDIYRVRERMRKDPSEFEQAAVTSRIPFIFRANRAIRYPFGVNLFGYAKGELGIGEDVRLLAEALKSQDIPFCVINIKLPSTVSQQDASVDQWLVDGPQYAINIFCSTGIEHTRYACEQGLELFDGRYTIGLWPWELPDWPASFRHAYSLVDEVWGISSYTANAYRDAPVPVHTMSLPVTVDDVAPLARADFDLPEADYLFLFSFDFNSTLTRKNPFAVVQAFQRAFPRSAESRVGLVLKASHVSNNKQWSRIQTVISADARIRVLDETLRRPQLLALYRCCDCYVSLHRAEGFGRGLAEALLLDMQLITTAYSGNLDFCEADRVALVRSAVKPLQATDYFHAEGQYWAEPDLAHAAELMRQVRDQPKAAGSTIDLSPATVGRRYAQRLHQIRQMLMPDK
jgi:glycosyltransferase involved in cell wall biosynthesis